MVENTIIIIILFAIGFQVIRLHVKQDKRYKEIMARLEKIDRTLNKTPEK